MRAGGRKATEGAGSERPGRWRRLGALAGVVVVVVTVVGAHLAGPGPAPTLHPPRRVMVVGGLRPRLAWPWEGEAAVAIPETGLHETSAPERPVPVASLTKIMTAYVVLSHHPLGLKGQGPTLTMAPADVMSFDQEVAEDQSSIPVVAGEQLTERQLLEGMIVHSAGNFAEKLATWDAGSDAAFVAEMNATARRLHLAHTHYADVSGFDPGSVSTARDQLRLAEVAMGDPAFAQIAGLASVDLPVVGVQVSYTPLVGSLGVVGVKSGVTGASGGCIVLAVQARLGARPPSSPGRLSGRRRALVFVAITGQEGQGGRDVLLAAAEVAYALAEGAARATVSVHLLRRGQVVGTVSAGGGSVPLVTASGVRLLAAGGQRVAVVFRQLRPVTAATSGGTVVGRETLELGQQRRSVAVRLGARPKGEGLLEHLF